ncbi:MAG: hypothetical protein IBX68_05165 [Dehalococcoidia bacterium]|nr:hypothetical protein [Dehalococcoidia bacterium]
MLDNNAYNLIAQAVEESKSLWRMKDTYREDALGCEECIAFWDKMVKDKEDHLTELREVIASHL